MSRIRVNPTVDGRVFSGSAVRTKRINLGTRMRGGIRL